MHKYIVSCIHMTCIYDFFGYYTLSGMTVSENRARSQCFLNNFKVKANRTRCLLTVCDRHVLTVWCFISTYRVPARGVLWRGDAGERLAWLHLLCPSSQAGFPVHCQKVETLLMLLVQFPLKLACLPLLSVISLLGHFLTINLVFAFLELLPAASFGIHNACQSVADHTLFVSVIFMQYFFFSSIFNL